MLHEYVAFGVVMYFIFFYPPSTTVVTDIPSKIKRKMERRRNKSNGTDTQEYQFLCHSLYCCVSAAGAHLVIVRINPISLLIKLTLKNKYLLVFVCIPFEISTPDKSFSKMSFLIIVPCMWYCDADVEL